MKTEESGTNPKSREIVCRKYYLWNNLKKRKKKKINPTMIDKNLSNYKIERYTEGKGNYYFFFFIIDDW